MAERTLTVKILGDAKGAQKAFAALEKDADGIGAKMGAVAGALGKVFVASGVAATAFGVKAVLSASDLAETMSKVGVVFGEQQKVVTAFADQMAKDFGTPKREILDAAASIGLIGKASGLSQGDAAKMSTQLAKLATDAASFYNVPLPEALQAIQSGLVGEAEPMRRFGVLLNAQAVDAEAARLGLQKVGKEYTEGAKAQARASLIMAGMEDASGDLERTQGSLANRLKELRGRAENFAADVGTKLLPIVLDAFDIFEKWGGSIKRTVEPVIKTLGLAFRALIAAFKEGDVTSDGLVGAFERIGNVARTVVLGVRALFLAFRDGDVTSDGFVGAMERIGVAVRAVVDFVKDNAAPVLAGLGAIVATVVVPAFVTWASAAIAAAAAQIAAAAPAIALAAAVGALAAGVVWAYQRFEGFREVVDGVAKFLTGTMLPAVGKLASYVTEQLGTAVEFVKRIWPQVSEAIGHVLAVAAATIRVFVESVTVAWRMWGDDLVRLVRTAFDFVRGTIDNVLQVVRGVIQTVLAVINGDWGRAWDGIKQVFAGVWDQITNVLRTAVGTIRSVVGGIGSVVGEALESIVGAIGRMPGRIASAAAGMFDGIRNAFRSAINWIIRAWNGLEFKIPGFDPPGPGPTFGGFTLGVPNIPTLHSGGVFRAPRPGGEGLALLRDMETVLPPGASGGGSIIVHNHIAGNVVVERDLHESTIRAVDEYVRRNGPRDW